MSKIKWPTSIKIQNQTWTIEYCSIYDRLKEMEQVPDGEHGGQNVLGFCNSPGRQICIEEDMSDGSKAEVLIHECGHAYNSVLPSPFDGEQDEPFAQIFATAVMDLILNNDLKWVKAGG